MEDNKDVQETEEKVEETTQKTYTQEDLDNSFNAGRKKASKDWQKDEQYKEFVAWKKTSQSDSEKMAELQSSNETLKKENALLKATNKVAKSDVKSEFLKFVTSEVMSLTSDTVDFETALKNYKNDNPQFFGGQVVKKVQTSPTLSGGNKPQTSNEIMNDLLRSKI